MKLVYLERPATFALVAAAVAIFVAECIRMHSPLVDDAAISIAYARTFFGGGGLRLTFASAQVEGFSSPLWLLLSGLAFPLHLEPYKFTQGLGVAFGALAVGATALFGPFASGRQLRLEDATAPLLLCCAPTLVFWADSGMESSLHAFLLVASVLSVIRDERSGRGSLCGLWLGLLCLTRPEAPLYVLIAGAWWVGVRALAHQRPGLQEGRIAAWLVVIVGGYLAFRWAVFARLLPNTYYAKRWWDYHTADYLRSFAIAHRAMLGVFLAGGLLTMIAGDGAARRAAALVFLLLGGTLFFIVSVKADWMSEWRFCAPYLPLVALALGAGASALRTRFIQAGLYAAAAVAASGLLLVFCEQGPRFEHLRKSPGFPAEYVAGYGRELHSLCGSLGITQGRLAFPDLGGTSMLLAHDEIVDVAGLADFAIAQHVYDRAAQEDYLLSEGLPDVVDPHGQAIPIGHFSRLMSHYTSWHGTTVLLRGLTRDEDPRCPGGLLRTRQLSAQALEQELQTAMASGDPATAIALWRCVQQHLPNERLPGLEAQQRLSSDAQAASEAAGDPLLKLRFLSLATILSGENAHLRRATEELRALLSASHLLTSGRNVARPAAH